jgi:glycosyltransferase involved in cell wall biosynthesis
LDHPEWYSPDIVEIHREKNLLAAERAHRIIAVSEFTRERFLTWFPHVDRSRIHAVGHGVSSDFSPAEPAEVKAVMDRYRLAPPYLLFVGNREKRKNPKGLIKIFQKVAGEDRGLTLVLVGMRPWLEGRKVHGAGSWVGQELEAEVGRLGLDRKVRVLGRLPLCELVPLYSGAAAFLFPSLYEGFGFPVLEAMACGTPVVASRRTAIPEVVGDAGLLADPEDTGAFSESVLNVLRDPDLSQDLRIRGLERARTFSWEDTGRETMKVYEASLRDPTS